MITWQKMKTNPKRLKVILLTASILLAGIILLISLPAKKTSAASTASDPLDAILDQPMNSKNFIYGGIQYNIEQYYGSLYGNNYQPSVSMKFHYFAASYKIDFLAPDPITSLIPRAVFNELRQRNDGIYYHMGAEWGRNHRYFKR